MRLKQLLGVLLSLLVLTSMAAAAGTHLMAVQAQPQGAGTTITIHASGSFTHTEYRPEDDTLLVDLAGVSAGQVDARLHALNMPGVTSYEVTSFQSAGGAEVTRVQFHLQGTPAVSLADGNNALTVNVAPTAAAAQAPAVPAVAKSAAVEPPAETVAAAAQPVTIEHIGVVRGADGSSLEIRGTGVMTGKVLRLSSPDRLVLDLPNTVLGTRARRIPVGSADVKDVRVARYQLSPPVTRVVLDLNAQRDWELTPAGNKLVLKMRAPLVAAAAAPATQATDAPIPGAAAAAPEPAKDFVMVQPTYQPKSENTESAAAQPPADPVARAADAAAKFTPATTSADVPLVAHVVPPVNAALAADAQAAPAVNPAALPQQQASSTAKRYTGEPISLNLKDADLLDFFRLIHEISGLNVVLDPNVKGRITLVLDDVPWDQALDIVLKNNGLDMQLEGNVLRIATVDTMRREADARRAQAEAQALAADKVTVTRFLSYAHAKDVSPTIKKLLSQRGDVFSDDRTNALIIQDIPAVFPAIDRLLAQLDRKTQEVEIEARVVAATRNFARDIGTQLGFGWGNGVNTTVGGAASGNTPTNVTLPGGGTPQYTTVGTGQIPFFSNFAAQAPTSGLALVNATRTYRLDFYLTMAESRGLLKILSRPRVVTQNNIQALVKQGLRIPIVTSAQLGGPATTTYVDAFLRLTVTPQITAENTIFLNVDVENTVPDFGHVNNLGNPTLITQQATTQVLVTDGGTVVIGGVIQTQNSVSVFQVPLLGDIPGLGNLFKRRSVTTQTQELIFFITPKIIQT